MNTNNLEKECKSLKKRYPHPQMCLSDLLRKIHDENNVISNADIKNIAEFCQTDEASVKSIVDYYPYFQKKNQKSISVCMGLPCYINGAESIFEDLTNQQKKLNGNGKKIIASSCLGNCYAAPVVLDNSEQ